MFSNFFSQTADLFINFGNTDLQIYHSSVVYCNPMHVDNFCPIWIFLPTNVKNLLKIIYISMSFIFLIEGSINFLLLLQHFNFQIEHIVLVQNLFNSFLVILGSNTS